jgi:hypothetical protein
MIIIQNVRYQMKLRAGGDVWCIHGNVYGHPDIPDGDLACPSTPISFDEPSLTFKTASGKEYKIETFADEIEKDKFLAQVKKDIDKGGYEVH